MDGYKVFSLNDPKKESITSWCASSLKEAEERFAKIKQLPLEDFKKIYGVCKLESDLYR
tara:strand:+ start:1023 stop:1199 length:177 start_codon:yes stop_codon:yes gene_type:complete